MDPISMRTGDSHAQCAQVKTTLSMYMVQILFVNGKRIFNHHHHLFEGVGWFVQDLNLIPDILYLIFIP